MATIKSCTDIKQSKKLAEILPLESADMYYMYRHWEIDENTIGNQSDAYIGFNSDFYYGADNGKTYHYIPAWSLAALLDILPKDKSIDCAITFGYYNGKGEYIEKWLCAFEKEGETTDDFIIETIDGSNPVDACYEMILKLHELKLL